MNDKASDKGVGKIGRALSSLLDDSDYLEELSEILSLASRTGRVSYREVKSVLGGKANDVLLLANEWRMLIPEKTIASGAWEDRILLAEPGESYEMPKVVRRVLDSAKFTGRWNPNNAIAELFEEMGDSDWEQIPGLVGKLRKIAKNDVVNANQLNEVCGQLDLRHKTGQIVAELKAAGAMSPKLSSIDKLNISKGPLYELNPSLFIDEKGMVED